jgi:hypothetical protein
MVNTTVSNPSHQAEKSARQALVNGKRIDVNCVQINGQTYATSGNLVKIARLEDEWYEDVHDPASTIAQLASVKPRPDIFTFWQRVPDTEPKYGHQMEWESLAVLPIQTFDHWWKHVKGTTRNMVRKSQKAGVEVREAAFDDDFIRGMVDIFNESPVRQGFRFWHYGKNFDTVKREFSRFLFREDLIGAYYQGELIGFAMLANAGRYGVMGQFIAKMKHRDKATNNALMAKTIEVCAMRRLPYLVYTTWRETSLVGFKRHCGFEEMKVPRYFVPLTNRGKLALKLGFHQELRDRLPDAIKRPLKQIRKRWFDFRWCNALSDKNSAD